MITSYRPELIATARDLEELKTLANVGADAITIGHQSFGLRVTGDFELDEIRRATTFLHRSNKKVYIVMNAIFHNKDLVELPTYIKQLIEIEVDGIICGDPSIFPILDEIDLSIPVFWNPETLSTNYETLKFWQSKGIKRAILSNELALDAIIDIKNEVKIPVEIQVHGMTCIFQSKRKLVTNYYNHIQDSYSRDKRLHLKQFNEAESNYPVFEDCNGTHIMSNEDLCMIENLQPILDAGIDSIRINGMFKSRSYNQAIVTLYREAIDLFLTDRYQYNSFNYLNSLRQRIASIQPEDRLLDTGFYFKEQIY
ncbi:peptidase U32 family protein [Aquibacillus rhizosphaerae]|uniref:Peptidase U32 family protein n=1 Tax=Aquibacillus rhizosphaerae TaxID=3051431 RepID=A0ABT7L1K8_9BACI|nr:peptidase U32 family protein [Aquibacillus sp. LR5S19]MDL4839699.1 peptidase U32 family protein [Aquibacillus sp. LR5S19]